MIYAYAYFVAGYSLVLLLLWMIRRSSFCRSWVNWQKQLAFCLVISVPLLPYAWVELVTASLWTELSEPTRNAIVDVGGRLPISSLKVLRYWRGNASVYVVSKCGGRNDYVGDIIHLNKASGRWTFKGDYETVWSDCGSADGNTFPPYRAKGDYE